MMIIIHVENDIEDNVTVYDTFVLFKTFSFKY